MISAGGETVYRLCQLVHTKHQYAIVATVKRSTFYQLSPAVALDEIDCRLYIAYLPRNNREYIHIEAFQLTFTEDVVRERCEFSLFVCMHSHIFDCSGAHGNGRIAYRVQVRRNGAHLPHSPPSSSHPTKTTLPHRQSLLCIDGQCTRSSVRRQRSR